jgi:hypothetical protein
MTDCCSAVLLCLVVSSPSNLLPSKVSVSLWNTTKSQEATSGELTHLCVDLSIAAQMGLKGQVHCHGDLSLTSFPLYHIHNLVLFIIIF